MRQIGVTILVLHNCLAYPVLVFSHQNNIDFIATAVVPGGATEIGFMLPIYIRPCTEET